jgi:hypothetical protein
MSTAIPLSSQVTSNRWQQNFLMIVTVVETHAKIRFRGLNRTAREEAVAEAVAAACVNYRHLARQGKLNKAFTSTMASFATRTVAQDRHVGGKQNAKDVLSPLAQRRHNFGIQGLPATDYFNADWRDIAVEDKKAGPAEIAALRIDFQDWLKTFGRRDRQIINLLAAGHRTSAVARRFGLSAPRVSQMRRQFEQSWNRFQWAA